MSWTTSTESGMSSTSRTSRCSKAPTQQVPRPRARAARAMCSSAMATSMRKLGWPQDMTYWCSGAQAAMTTGASPTNCWLRAAAISPARSSASRTTTKRHSWRLPAEGASRAASSTCASLSSSTSLSSYDRTLRRWLTTSKRSMAVPPDNGADELMQWKRFYGRQGRASRKGRRCSLFVVREGRSRHAASVGSMPLSTTNNEQRTTPFASPAPPRYNVLVIMGALS